MNKSLMMGLGAAGAGGLGFGGYSLLKPKEETFRSKYQHSLINKEGDNQIWESRYSTLKGKSPKFQLLKEVAQKNDDAQTSKSAHKEACLKLYDTPTKDTQYFEDFENYCSKHIEDMVTGGTLIADNKNTGTKWDTKLTALKNLTGTSIDSLSEKLKELKTTMGDQAASETHRESLKNWCDATKTKIFLGAEDSTFKDVNTYCVHA
ncbi:hypothetical protein HF1_04780 [Mycoplasma haemofelis str. Langford 1]|uniref:Uncharacterized protein n=1 Tax=Mycoplasma haemofelis (strain Langford 1) TaxID=941640 RepID=E8ZH65_MYCHL|nr:hypothetical protein [Mycoplasma haemofelis]CBY92486.1 hypothetical protein HF1_04780 [Mycoplasma haemofelis str. Langford 1]